jgi:hypothetical protein
MVPDPPDKAKKPKPRPYEATSFRQGAEAMKAWKPERLEDGWELVGKCPVCHHPATKFIPDDVIVLEQATAAAPASRESYVVRCNCEMPHPGGPAEVRGCGAYWGAKIEVAKDKEPDVLGPAPVGEREAKWEKRAEELEFETLTKVRGAAEKWAATLAALLALVATVLVVKGPDELAELPDQAQRLTAALLAVAFALAVIATVLVALAAQGTPKNLERPSGSALRRSERDSAEAAKGQLRWSRALTVVAVIVLAGAVAATWAWPQPESGAAGSTVLFTPAAGKPICGSLVNGQNGLRVEAGDRPVALPKGPYDNVIPVESCPAKARAGAER